MCHRNFHASQQWRGYELSSFLLWRKSHLAERKRCNDGRASSLRCNYFSRSAPTRQEQGTWRNCKTKRISRSSRKDRNGKLSVSSGVEKKAAGLVNIPFQQNANKNNSRTDNKQICACLRMLTAQPSPLHQGTVLYSFLLSPDIHTYTYVQPEVTLSTYMYV